MVAWLKGWLSRLGIGEEVEWSRPPQLAGLKAFYEREAANPDAISDEEFLAKIRNAFWATNCWSFVEAAFAIIAPGCARRPHLARQLIRSPIDAMVAGGLEDPAEVIAQGVALATKPDPYVKPTEEGLQWLLTEWPQLEAMAREVFDEIMREATEDGEDSSSGKTGLQQVSCPTCNATIFHDGSAAGASIPCAECDGMITLPGEKPAQWEAKTEDYDCVIYGQHPVQADGTVAGHPFYFRAKWNFWDFTVCISHDDEFYATTINPPDETPGFFRDREYEGYWIGEDYGTNSEASFMSIDTSRAILERCLSQFLEDLRNR